ncbi:FMN-binding protein [Treponema sp. OMZ 792]|uniref:FMN-binding protein n=1 Tax=unclassified Treponema TaxID=2638727 RepID=UPI0020A3B40F|nr:MULTISPECIES: FMN-binding protein [unclassified Treponema]UTC76197.1 FMN-binding protein [Treponema sp. OMZ 792]UTC77925.1 FMN-binding protein [Treponema sp. OMZ 799]UTC80198.1 FMN-binding protein [Treponema sp. OMZ 798]
MKHYKIILAALCVTCIFSCSKPETKKTVKYKDGVYKALSGLKDDWGGTAEVEIKVENNKIVECTFLSYEKNGNLKGPDYGKTDGVIKNMGLYKIAQASVLRSAEYGQKLVEAQNIDEVDVIAGASISYKLFKDAVETALKDAKEN